ncbi:MAG: type II secretion system protein [Pseudomonadota bacterium]
MYATKHSGFAMILAIFIVVLIALGGVILLGNTSIGAKSIGDNYLKAQAELLAMSATEFAVMRAQDFDTLGANCLNQLNITVQDATGSAMFDANVTISYSFKGAKPVNGQCNTLDENATKPVGGGAMMLIDTVVTTTPGTNLSTEPIRVFKRTWQKL